MKTYKLPSPSARINGIALVSVLLLSAVTTSGCADTSAAKNATNGAPAQKEYRPPRVETTGSLISRAVVAHVDDDDDESQADDAHTHRGANSTSELLNGNSAFAGSRVNPRQ
jgi:hypothetical protein